MDMAAIRAQEAAASAQVSQQVRPSSEELAQQRELIHAVRAVNESQSLGSDRELTFALDRGTRRVVVRLVDKTTREVLLQIPTERLLRLAEEAASA